MKISPEHRQQLDEQGYVIIPDVLSESEISHYRALLLHLAEQERKKGSSRVHTIRNGELQ